MSGAIVCNLLTQRAYRLRRSSGLILKVINNEWNTTNMTVSVPFWNVTKNERLLEAAYHRQDPAVSIVDTKLFLDRTATVAGRWRTADDRSEQSL